MAGIGRSVSEPPRPQSPVYHPPSLRRPVAALRGPHRKPLKLRGLDLKVRFDGSIARLLDAGDWLRLRAGGWRGLSWDTSTLVAAFRSERLLAGFDALSGV